MTSSLRIALPFVFAMASGCDMSPPVSGGRNVASEAQPRVGARTPAVAPPYMQRAEADRPVPDTDDRGRFSIEQGCVVFTTLNGTRYAPVLPAGSGLATDRDGRSAIEIAGRAIALDQVVSLTGGEGPYAPAPPPSCPQKQFLVGGVR